MEGGREGWKGGRGERERGRGRDGGEGGGERERGRGRKREKGGRERKRRRERQTDRQNRPGITQAGLKLPMLIAHACTYIQ